MGLTRAELWGMLDNITPVESTLLSAYENEEQQIWRDGIGNSPHGQKWNTSFHASSFPGDDPAVCGRAQVYKLLDPAPAKPVDPKTRVLWDEGTMIEHMFVKRWSNYGVLLSADVTGDDQYQTGFEDPSCWLTGSPDAIILPPFYTKSHVLDVKTTCLTGDTLVAVADGRNAVSLKQLSEEGKDVDVYSSDNGKTVIKRIRNVHKTKTDTKIVKVNLDDGSYIRCTPDHKFYLFDKTYCRADELKSNTSLMRFDSWAYPDNSGAIRRNIWLGPCKGAGKCWEAQFRLIGKRKFKDTKGYIIHHCDEDSLNDVPNNLDLLTNSDHAKAHHTKSRSELISRVSKEKWASQTPEERSARGYKMAANRDQNKTNENLRKAFSDRGAIWRKERARKSVESQSPEQRSGKIQKIWAKRYDSSNKIILPSPDERRQIRKRARLTQAQLAEMIGVSKSTVVRWEDKLEIHPPIEDNRKRYKETLDSLSCNHKVVSVEYDGYEDTYCGTVEETGNFAIITSGNDFKNDKLSGVVVSNSHEKILNMRADPNNTIYSHKKYIRQIKAYISEANKKFSPTVVTCDISGLLIKSGKSQCPLNHRGNCMPRILKVEPPDDGTLFYSSREEPLLTASYYITNDSKMIEIGKDRLRTWKQEFIDGKLPEHVREGESAKWTIGECKYCLFKPDFCKQDFKNKVKDLKDSELINFNKKLKPNYDYNKIRQEVLDRWE